MKENEKKKWERSEAFSRLWMNLQMAKRDVWCSCRDGKMIKNFNFIVVIKPKDTLQITYCWWFGPVCVWVYVGGGRSVIFCCVVLIALWKDKKPRELSWWSCFIASVALVLQSGSFERFYQPPQPCGVFRNPLVQLNSDSDLSTTLEHSGALFSSLEVDLYFLFTPLFNIELFVMYVVSLHCKMQKKKKMLTFC